MTRALMASISDWCWRNHVRTLAAPSGLSNPTLSASAFSTCACTAKEAGDSTRRSSTEPSTWNMSIPTQSTGSPCGAYRWSIAVSRGASDSARRYAVRPTRVYISSAQSITPPATRPLTRKFCRGLMTTSEAGCTNSYARASAAWRLCVPVPAWIAVTSSAVSRIASAAVDKAALRLATLMLGRLPPALRPRMKRQATALLINGCVVAVAAFIQSPKLARQRSSA